MMCIAFVAITAGAFRPVFAAETPRFYRESFSLNKDETAMRRLDDAQEYIRTKRWDQAADLLIQLSRERGKSLLPMSPGWYISVSRRCNLLVAALPADGLAAYRKKIDARAGKWLRDGLKNHDEQLLHRVLREAFVSSSGDDALLTLGQWAWDQGDMMAARQYWSRILPLAKPTADESTMTGDLHFPDTNHDVATIRARLILCDMMTGRFKNLRPHSRSFANNMERQQAALPDGTVNTLTFSRRSLRNR